MAVLTTHQPWKQRMAQEYIDDEEEYEEEAVARRPVGPRFGPFVTIAVAILLLFGAASRIGKPAESGNWLSIDLLASKSLNTERLRLQEQRNTTLVTLGAVPVQHDTLRPTARSLRVDGQVLPPPRGEIDYNEYQELRRPPTVPLSLAVPTTMEGNTHGVTETYIPGERFDPAPEAQHRPPQPAGETTYVVATGDNWVKIGKATNKKWQDIQKANPQTADGLRVGMRLVIP